MTELTRIERLRTPQGTLFERADFLIEHGQRVASRSANAAQTLTFWRVGLEVHQDILQEQRADYGKQIVSTLSTQLVGKRGRSYAERNLRRMIQFARLFPDPEMVSMLSTQLHWSHIVELLPLKSAEERLFYADQAARQQLGVQELSGVMARKAFERKEIANSRVVPGGAVPLDVFRDPYLLDFLNLNDGYLERDLETAILRDIEAFLLETGNEFALAKRQKRMIIDGEDHYLDLLFYSRAIRRLIAVELKIGPFKAAYKAQMELYLRWLDAHERHPWEETTLGLILCTEAGREKLELLEMHTDGIVVAEYWTALPPKEDLKERLQSILIQAKERMASCQQTAAGRERAASPIFRQRRE
jgi:predicted nuclease of restriction endonuclease-like (RecB) superfamily